MAAVAVDEAYPDDRIAATLVRGMMDDTAMGFHAGGDLGRYFSRIVGAGFQVRFAQARKQKTIFADRLDAAGRESEKLCRSISDGLRRRA